MRGIFTGPGLAMPRALRQPLRQAQCSTCRALRESLGSLGPTLHRHDLSVLATLGPEPSTTQSSSWCSALPLVRVPAARLEASFAARLTALAVALDVLEALDDELDGDRAGPLRRLRRSLSARASHDGHLGVLGTSVEALRSCAQAIAARERIPGLVAEAYLEPVRELAATLFVRLYAGSVPPSEAAQLGRDYASVLCLLDALADLDGDRARGRFNLWTAHATNMGTGPAAVLEHAAQGLGQALLLHCRPAAREAVAHQLERGLVPRVRSARRMAGEEAA